MRLRIGTAIFALMTSGCKPAEVIGDDRNWYLWAPIALGIYIVVSFAWSWIQRSGQLNRWNLKTSPSDPGVTRLVVSLTVAALVGLLGWGIFNAIYFETVGMRLFSLNLLAAFVGSALGVGGGIAIGTRMAERRYITANDS